MATLDLTASAHLTRLPTSFDTHTAVGKFAGRFDYRYQGKVVCAQLVDSSWNVTTFPGLDYAVGGGDFATVEDDINNADYVYYGGQTYTVNEAALITALSTAGYTVS